MVSQRVTRRLVWGGGVLMIGAWYLFDQVPRLMYMTLNIHDCRLRSLGTAQNSRLSAPLDIVGLCCSPALPL